MGCSISSVHSTSNLLDFTPITSIPAGDAGDVSSHLIRMRNHLSLVPVGRDAQGKVRMIRLLRKSLFCQNQRILSFINQIINILTKIKCTVKNLGDGWGDSMTNYEMYCNITDDGRLLLDELLSDADSFREFLQEKLFWTDKHQSDDIFELFYLDNCPSFTFISHRWAPNNRALGLHNELAFVIGLCPTEYVWLDCGCAPQDSYSQENGDCLKVIWNIQDILDKAERVLSYYATDGFCIHGINNSDHQNNFSSGILRIVELTRHIFHYGCTSTGLIDVLENKVKENSARTSARLWCVLEKLLGGNKLIKTYQGLSLPCSVPTYTSMEAVAADDDELEFRGGVSHSSIHPATYNMLKQQAFERSLYISLDCFDQADVHPLTQILYSSNKLPAVFDATMDKLPYIVNETPDARVYALRLPRLEVSDSECRLVAENGWKHNGKQDDDRIFILENRIFYFHCGWPQNDLHPVLRLQIHSKCLQNHSSDLWLYNADAAQRTGYFSRKWDECKGKRGNHKVPCILCTDSDENINYKPR